MQWGLMICVYCISHVPALLTLDIPGYEGRNLLLIVFLVLVVQSSDVLQYVWGKLFGKHKVAPEVSPSKTVEGLVGGVLSRHGARRGAVVDHAVQRRGRPRCMALAINVMGFFGGLVMSAIKRDRGVKDWGHMIEGHGGMLDRLDSVVFAAPIFFHLTRYWWTPLRAAPAPCAARAAAVPAEVEVRRRLLAARAARDRLPVRSPAASISRSTILRALAVAFALEPHLRLRDVGRHVADDARRVLVEHVRADAGLVQAVGDQPRVVALPRDVDADHARRPPVRRARRPAARSTRDERRRARRVPRIRRRLVHVAALRRSRAAARARRSSGRP